MSLNSLSTCLSDLGRREEALAAIEEAVASYRELAAAYPDAFRSDLAKSLNSLSTCLGDLGRYDEVSKVREELDALGGDAPSITPCDSPHATGQPG